MRLITLLLGLFIFSISFGQYDNDITCDVSTGEDLANSVNYNNDRIDTLVLKTNFKTPEEYGAVGDGVADDTDKFLAAATAASEAGIALLLTGDYLLNTVELPDSLEIIGMNSKVIQKLTSNPIFTITGTLGSDVGITENIGNNEDTITVTDASSLSIGDYVLVSDDDYTGDYYRGETFLIDTIINTNTLIFSNRTICSYTTADNLTVEKISFKTDINISGIDFVGIDSVGTNGVAIDVDYGKKISIINCSFRHFHNTSISLITCIDFTGSYNIFEDAETFGVGYGYKITSYSNNFNITNNTARNLRHFFTTTNLIYNGVIANNVITDGRSVSIDTHHGGCFLNIVGNTISGGGISLRPGTSVNVANNVIKNGYLKATIGFELPTILTFHNNTIDNTGFGSLEKIDGITIEFASTYNEVESLSITNNKIRGSDDYGILINTTVNDVAKNINVSNNHIEGFTNGGIRLLRVTDSDISNNKVIGDGTQTYGIYFGSECSENNVIQNVVKNTSTGIYAIGADGTGFNVSSNRIIGTVQGISLRNLNDFLCNKNYIDTATNCMIIHDCDNGNIIGNTIKNPENSSTYSGIWQRNTSAYNNIKENIFINNRYCLRADATTSNSTFGENVIINNLVDLLVNGYPSDLMVYNNNGYVTRTSGTVIVTNGNTYVDWSHGLDVTPSINNISIVPQEDLGNASQYWVNGVGSSTIRVNVDVDPGEDISFSVIITDY